MIQYNDPAVTYNDPAYTWDGELTGAPPTTATPRDEAWVVVQQAAPSAIPLVTGNLRARQATPTAALAGDVYPPDEGWLLGLEDGSEEAGLI